MKNILPGLFDRRVAVVYYLGILSGFPWVLTGSAMTLWLKEVGMTRAVIGYFGSIFGVYAINFLWAPFLDRLRPPLLGSLGLRRSWLVLCLFLIAMLTLSLSFFGPGLGLLWTSLIALGIAAASATQDVVIDAYRIESFAVEEEQGLSHASAAATAGWWGGYGYLGGALALLLGGESVGLPWATVYRILAVVVLLQIFIVMLCLREPAHSRVGCSLPKQQSSDHAISHWLRQTLIAPLAEFFQRSGLKLGLLLLVFVLTFKLGEAFLGRMSIVFYKEIGFTTDQINLYSKLFGGILTAIFAFIGAAVNAHFGIIRGLMLGGISMAASNLLFSWIAMVGPDTRLFALAIVVDGVTGAFATVAFVAFISYFTSRTYTATQYAVLASVGNLGRTLLSSTSGEGVDLLGGQWALFFFLTALAVIPPLVLLARIAPHLRAMRPGDPNATRALERRHKPRQG